MKILIKVSGDLINNYRVIKEIKRMARTNNVTFIHGAGTQISKALQKKNIHYKFINGIRHTTNEGLKICYNKSQKIRKELEERLNGVDVHIISPVSKENEKIINRNAEEIFRGIHMNFDRKIIFTASDREKPLIKDINDAEIIKIDPLQEDIMRQ